MPSNAAFELTLKHRGPSLSRHGGRWPAAHPGRQAA